MSIFSLFNRKKDYSATINSDSTVVVKAGQNLLAAGLEAGLAWPHHCRVGSCGTCQCYLRKGKIKRLSDFSYVLDGDQLNDGMILACQSELRSDVEVEVSLSDTPIVEAITCSAKLTKMQPLTHDILQITVSCDEALPPTTLAGQYAEVRHKNFKHPRSYSFAKAPANEDPNEVTFFVRHVPGGNFTDWLFAEDRTGAEFEISAPYGNFWLREGTGPIICLAGGSGLSAVKAILEHAANLGVQRDTYFLFGARQQRDLYCDEEVQAIEKAWHPSSEFEFIKVLSNEPEDSNWTGPRGDMTDYLQKAYIDTKRIVPSECQAYLCGPPPMIDASIEMLIASGVRKDEIFYDKFLDASTISGGR